jgi:ATP-binding protein involved in chromosome partitioning
MIDEASIHEALKTVKYPGFSRDIVSFGIVRSVSVEAGAVKVALAVTTSDAEAPAKIKSAVETCLRGLHGVSSVEVGLAVQAARKTPPASNQPSRATGGGQLLQGVRKVVAIASGKGGGNFRGIGILDGDVYGPSIPMMLGIADRPELRGEQIVPVESFGIRVISMGLLVDEEAPVVWRGPMVASAIGQFVNNVIWGPLDILFADLPPGTGDAQLSLAQTLPVDGAIIVTTPQTVAINVARRGARMFDKVNIPLLGVVENMSYLVQPDGQRDYLFGEGGGKRTADALECPLLGGIPLDSLVRAGGDLGTPIVLSHPQSAPAKEFMRISHQLIEILGLTD